MSAPAPPPPPPAVSAPPPKTAGRANLLKSIEGFKKGKLKKAKTVEKTAPLPSSSSSSTGTTASSSSQVSGSQNTAAPVGMALGGLFAGGMPSLRKTGRPGAATMLPAQSTPQPPKEPIETTAQAATEPQKALPVPPVKPVAVQPVAIPPVSQPVQQQPQIPPQIATPPSVPSTPAPATVPVPTPNPVNPSALSRPINPVLQPPPESSSRRTGTSLLPKISYQMNISMDEIEEHPSIPTFHNPLSVSLQKFSSPTNITDMDIPEEEQLPIEEFSISNDDATLAPLEEEIAPQEQQSYEVYTMDISDDTHQPKAACELQPKRQQLLRASREGDIDALMSILQQETTQMRRKELLNGLDIDLETNRKSSPLHVAIENGHLSMVATLLSQGANTLLEDAMGNTAIHTACKTQHPDSMEIFSFLMNSACNVKAQNRAGNTPLHVACMTSAEKVQLYPEMVYTLVTNPFADLLIQNSQGFTALMFAAQSGDIGVVKLILSRLPTADAISLLNMQATVLSSSGAEKVTAVSIAADRDSVGPITKLLMEYGASPSPDNKLQSSLGPLLCRMTSPPIIYPTNRFARILTSQLLCKPANDDDAVTCLECNVKFSVVTRRHHCRSCGMVFCSKCSSYNQILPPKDKSLRVCANCDQQIRWFSPLQLVTCDKFIQREALIYRAELEQFHDDSVAYVIERFDTETNISQMHRFLAEPSWQPQFDVGKFKLDDAFTVSKLPTGQGHLPNESYCSLFEFAAMIERIKLISAYCLDVHDIVDQDEISLSDSSSGNSISESQQRAAVFILLCVGAQLYSLISRMADGSSLFKFLDSSYYKIRAILQFICELKPCSDKKPVEFSFDVLNEYSTQVAVPMSPSVTRVSKEVVVDPIPVPSKPVVSEIDIEPLPLLEEPAPKPVEEKRGSGLLTNLFTRKTEASNSSKDLPQPPEDIPPPPPAAEAPLPPMEGENSITSPAESSGLFKKIFSRKTEKKEPEAPVETPSDDELLDEDECVVEDDAAPVKPSGGLFSKLFSSKNETNEEESSQDELDTEDIAEEEPQTEEEPKKKPLLHFFKGLRSSTNLSNESEEKADVAVEEEPKAPAAGSRFSWFRKKASEPELEAKSISEKGVPMPSPSLDLEDEGVPIPPPAHVELPPTVEEKNSPEEADEPALLQTPPPPTNEEGSAMNIETSRAPNLMSEMKNKLTGIQMTPPVQLENPPKKREETAPAPTAVVSESPSDIAKPLPTPPPKQPSYISKIREEKEKEKEREREREKAQKMEEEPFPEVENKLFADDADDDDDFLFQANKKEVSKKMDTPVVETKPLPTPPIIKEEPKLPTEPTKAATVKETDSELFGVTTKPEPPKPQPKEEAPSLFGDSTAKEATDTSSLFGGDEELFLGTSKKQSKRESHTTKHTKAPLEESSTGGSLFDSIDDDLLSFGSPKKQEISQSTGSLFGTLEENDSLLSPSTKPKAKPKLESQTSSSLFDFPDDDENALFSSPKPSTAKTTTKKKSNLFDDTEDLFGF